MMRKPVPRVIELYVHLAYDDEAEVWYVARSDIPGLRLEANDPQSLIQRLMECAPELIELNELEIQKGKSARKSAAPKASRRKPPAAARRAVAVRPVFDSPLQLAACSG